ncbi:hypothetical protein HKK52_08485 [Pseudomonas sp. ADAK2]|uniref:hypothetical protein n=1 Tax=unclassified Pseudomonas TaxID=196821 RepID=UPI001462C114|nr:MULTISPECIES: hypothetical protein [unclassified Pseudomonas]QJI40953.1 hypothetical protein HKK53_08480 [Pseudomonas sp. ADAK7]QJI47258.1 hypothetical protein HKK52_08485 [Pseudomonas sp. ADAK2]
MRHRGTQYWLWSNRQLHGRNHEEVLPDGTQIDIQARFNREQMTQVFIGVYAVDGAPLAEEFYDRESHPTLVKALEWGCARAQAILNTMTAFRAPHRIQLTLGVVLDDPCALALRHMEMSDEEALRLKRQDAWDEYLKAKQAVLEMMRADKVDSEIWERQKRRLRDAIDRRAALRHTWPCD